MTTQEKLEQKIFNLVYQWGEVGIVADHTAPTYVAYIQELIESAKREELIWIKEYVDEMYDEPLIYALQKRLAQLEQSEEGE